jgi:hypothetical protein
MEPGSELSPALRDRFDSYLRTSLEEIARLE